MRTRLSYAMIKVQNGWQAHNINDLEFMASKKSAPEFMLLGGQRRRDSDIPNILSICESGAPHPARRAITTREFNSSPIQTPKIPTAPDDPLEHSRSSKHRSLPDKIGATYESFWRKHEESGSLKPPEVSSPLHRGPSLAPPLDIIPRKGRRIGSPVIQSPPVRTKALHSIDNEACPDSTIHPTTPPTTVPSKVRTPSQQLAVEKDAVETLLFMSSPGNSGHQPPVTMSGTPLRSSFAPQTYQTADHLISRNHQPGNFTRQSRSINTLTTQDISFGRLISDLEINRILDEMPDTSGSDDDDLHNHNLT